MADLIDKAAAVAIVEPFHAHAARLIAALPAQGVRGCETGYFATAAIDFVHEMEARGFRCAAGQSDDDDLDFSISIYRDKEVIGCVSFHADRTWSCFMELDGKTFRENAIPWSGWPDGFHPALAPASGGVETLQSQCNGNAPVDALVKAAAQDAREVFEDYGSKAREAIDYMEQVALAAYRGDAK